MEQNIKLVHKVNEANHDYQVLRRRAMFRQKARLSKHDKLKRKHEAEIHRTIGVESFMSREREHNIQGAMIAVAMFIFIYSLLFWVVL